MLKLFRNNCLKKGRVELVVSADKMGLDHRIECGEGEEKSIKICETDHSFPDGDPPPPPRPPRSRLQGVQILFLFFQFSLSRKGNSRQIA